MRHSTSIATVVALAFCLQAGTAAASKEENIGVSSGAVIGALAGGPVGFFVGAVVGAKLGESAHNKSQQLADLDKSLQTTQRSVSSLQDDNEQLTSEIVRLENTARPELLSLMQAGIDMDLLFRTDEFALTDATGERISEMAVALANMPDVQIELQGYADERGDETYNQELSERRVEFVRNLLIGAGIHPMRISGSGQGEVVAAEQTVDSYALERRVSVKLFIDNSQSVAANPR